MNDMIDYDKFPTISDELIELLKNIFKDSAKNIETLEDLHYVKGQQAVVDFLDTVRINQQETGD